ncbi:hypothetical protein KQH97_06120 [Ruminococcus sp. MSJ-25]|uniref:hypothetical protein n=1 Tax=Ruminococcus sp. MSJ-25 TaxID=2841536 RepID=UPI001C11DAFB|nr:hypothetical protein [Ruminococcus sp. MSJ-25]MBU5407876.1 hypothetical protein [Ruminococcus sp. MSJ-25]
MQKNGISTYSDKKISVGDIRKTQLITTYGVGAIVDFKNDTIVIASTDDWDYSPNDADEVENRKIFSFLRSFNSFMLLSVCRYPHHIAYSALIFTCSTSSFPKNKSNRISTTSFTRMNITAASCPQRERRYLHHAIFQ